MSWFLAILLSLSLLSNDLVNINTADEWALRELPGIGPVRAEAIVNTRSELAFSSVEDLERVPGIGPKTRMRIERWVFVAQNEERTDSLRRRSRGDG